MTDQKPLPFEIEVLESIDSYKIYSRHQSWVAWRLYLHEKGRGNIKNGTAPNVCALCAGLLSRSIPGYGMGRCLCHILTEQTRLDRLHTDYASKIKDPQSWNAIDTGVKESKPGGARSFALFIDRMKAWQNRPLQWLYISGDVGTGKSMILKLMAYNIGPWCLYLDASDLSDMIFRATANKELSDLVEVLSTWPILMIDDLGAEHKTDFALNTVRAIINHRYAWPHEYVTVVGSNMSIQELRGDYDRRVGDRLLDQDITEVFNLNVTSYRVRSRLS